jgi:hypothetical protein
MQINDKVVCVDPIRDPATLIGVVMGETYTISDVVECDCSRLLIAVGQVSKKLATQCPCDVRHNTGEKLYLSKRFVPLQEWDDLGELLEDSLVDVTEEELIMT